MAKSTLLLDAHLNDLPARVRQGGAALRAGRAGLSTLPVPPWSCSTDHRAARHRTPHQGRQVPGREESRDLRVPRDPVVVKLPRFRGHLSSWGGEGVSAMPTRPPYAAEFRQQMVDLVRSGRAPEDLAREFEPSSQAIRTWVAQVGRDAGERSDGLRTEEREELRRLRRSAPAPERYWQRQRPGSRGRPDPGDLPGHERESGSRVATMARVLGVSPSGYYAWRRRPPSARARADAELRARVQAIHGRSRGTYGAPRIHAELTEGGVAVSRKRVARVMRSVGVAGVSRRRGPRTTRRNTQARPAPDRVERRFERAEPALDSPTSPTSRLYLAIVLDVFSRRVVGWAMAGHLRPRWWSRRWLAQRRPEAATKAASTLRWRLAAGNGASRYRWVRSAIASTMRWPRASSRPWSASCSTERRCQRTPKHGRRCSSSSRGGTTRGGVTPRSATGRHWSSTAPSGRRCGRCPACGRPSVGSRAAHGIHTAHRNQC